MANFEINGVTIKDPKGFDIEFYTLTKSTRVASGDMVMDFIANKRKFNFTYPAITSVELNTIIDLLWTNLSTTRQCFVTLTYLDDGVSKTAIVYAGSVTKKLHRSTAGTNWVWKDIGFSLIER